MKGEKMGMRRMGAKFLEERRMLILPGFLHAVDESEEDLRAMVGHFIGVCRRRDLKFNAGRNKVMTLNG